jgi:hypothetical protein
MFERKDACRASIIVTTPRLLPGLILCGILAGQSLLVEAAADERVVSVYPVTSGSAHSPEQPLSKIVVVSPQTGGAAEAAVAAAREILERGGLTVLSRPRSSREFEQQGPRARTGSPADEGWLALGAKAGADHVVIVEVTDTLVLDGSAPSGSYLHDERVSVRGIGVKRGTVALEGTARWSQPVEQAGKYLRELTIYAIARAICAPDKWVEASAFNQGRGRCRAQ